MKIRRKTKKATSINKHTNEWNDEKRKRKRKMELKNGNLAKIHHNWECIRAIVVLCLWRILVAFVTCEMLILFVANDFIMGNLLFFGHIQTICFVCSPCVDRFVKKYFFLYHCFGRHNYEGFISFGAVLEYTVHSKRERNVINDWKFWQIISWRWRSNNNTTQLWITK